MNEITELTTSELEQVEGGLGMAFLVNFALAESGFYSWANRTIASWFE